MLKLRWAIIFVGVALLCCSCAQPPQQEAPTEPEPPVQSAAETFFLQGNFANALLGYEHDYLNATTAEDRNGALYGMACTQLTLARSDSQLAEAITNLEEWENTKKNPAFGENSRLLVTALKKQSERIQKVHREQTTLAKQKTAVINNQREKIAQMAATIDNLQKQLAELEAIDEILQEKRKPL